MTVLTNGTRAGDTTLLGSGYSFVAKRVTAGKTRRRERGARVGAWFRGHVRQIREAVVNTVALGCADVAAYQWHLWAGLLATTVTVLLVHWSVERAGVGDVADR